jgi:hypothetical protein
VTLTVSVFISHSWSYSGHYDKLAEWIFQEQWNLNGTPITFFDTSVPQEDPIHFANNDQELYARILQRIGVSNVVVCPTGMYAHYSKWIKKELDGAQALRIPVLAVNPWAQQKAASVVSGAAHQTVGWNSSSVISGIWQLYSAGR